MLLQVLNEGFTIPQLAEKITVLAILAGLVYYFSKKVDSLEVKRESDRVGYESKHELLYDKFLEVEKNNNKVLTELTQSIRDLSSKINIIK
jgi:hypothetical protein